MTKRKYLEKCYYCGEPACTDEHVPPQTMFDSTCDSITVPSCEKHNTVKGASDQAVLNGFLLTLNGASTRYHFKQEVLNAAEKKQPSFKRTKYKTFSARLLENQEDLPAIGYVTSEVDVKKWMRHLTAALVWDGIGYFEYKINWSKTDVWSPHFIESSDGKPFKIRELAPIFLKKLWIQSELENLHWENGWSAHPRPYPSDIFSFQICFLPYCRIMFRYRLYVSYVWYATFIASKKAKAILALKVHGQM